MKVLLEFKVSDLENTRAFEKALQKQVAPCATSNYHSMALFFEYPAGLVDSLRPFKQLEPVSAFQFGNGLFNVSFTAAELANFESFAAAMTRQVGNNSYIGTNSFCVYFNYPDVLRQALRNPRKSTVESVELSSDQ